MTDKQVIINGIDVSDCEKQGETVAGITCGDGERIRLANEIITKHSLCKDKPNCVYKKFKRKEQSEAKLVGQIQIICDFINNRPETFKGVYGSVEKIITEYAERKEKECEELKEEINLLRQYKGSKQASYESMQAEWNNAVLQNRDLLKQVEKWQEKYNKLEAEVERLIK